ncbi:hypothetical protein ACFPM0_08000 [Pseudonocardia sulfidoxydans]
MRHRGGRPAAVTGGAPDTRHDGAGSGFAGPAPSSSVLLRGTGGRPR